MKRMAYLALVMLTVLAASFAADRNVESSRLAAAPKAKLTPAEAAVEAWTAGLYAQADLVAKSGDYERACKLLGRILYLDPMHVQAETMRRDVARRLKDAAAAEKKDIDDAKWSKAEEALRKAAEKEVLARIADDVKNKRYSDAAWWIRQITPLFDVANEDKKIAKRAETLIKKLRTETSNMAKAKAWWPVLSVAESLRLPPVKEGDSDVEIEKLLADGHAAVKGEIGLRDKDLADAMSKSIKRKASGHPLEYLMALPKDFDASSTVKYPVIVSVTGSGAVYDGEIGSWTNHREEGFILIAPITTSNTPKNLYADMPGNADNIKQLKFDSAGVHCLLEDLENLYAADRERFYVTGLSGGGNFTYYNIFQHPLKWRAGAPRNPNFYGNSAYGDNYELGKKLVPGGDVYFPVHIFTAEKDEYKESIGGRTPGVEPQTQQAIIALKKFRYCCWRRTEVPDVSHNDSYRYYDKIIAWFKDVDAGRHLTE